MREVLQTVVERGMSDEATDFAEGALMALSDKAEMQIARGGGGGGGGVSEQLHVMLSCEPILHCTGVI